MAAELFAVFEVGRVCAAASHRLAGVLGRRSWCEWCHWVRNVIADPFRSLVLAVVTGVAGDEPLLASALLSDDNRAPSALSDTVISVIKG